MEKRAKVSITKVLIAVFSLLIIVLIAGAGTYYFLNEKKNSQNTADNNQSQSQATITTSAASTTSTTKAVNRQTIIDLSAVVPEGWTVLTDSDLSMEWSNYVGMNIFSKNNLALLNEKDKYSVVINADSDLGRGGSCMKREIVYTLTVADKKVTFVKNRDGANTATGPEDYCYNNGEPLTGYVISASEIGYNGHKYLIHSEGQVADDQVDEIVKNFESIISSITLK